MSFNLYLVGFLLVIAGLVLAANLLGLPGQWIAIGAIVLVGFGILTAVKNTKQRDPGI